MMEPPLWMTRFSALPTTAWRLQLKDPTWKITQRRVRELSLDSTLLSCRKALLGQQCYYSNVPFSKIFLSMTQN